MKLHARRSNFKWLVKANSNGSRNNSYRNMSSLWSHVKQKLIGDIEKGASHRRYEFNGYFNIKASQVIVPARELDPYKYNSKSNHKFNPRKYSPNKPNYSNSPPRLLNKSLYSTQTKFFVQSKSSCADLQRGADKCDRAQMLFNKEHVFSINPRRPQAHKDSSRFPRNRRFRSALSPLLAAKCPHTSKRVKDAKQLVSSLKHPLRKLKPFSIHITINRKSKATT
eukprot:TRINITY_DN10130_c0_g1_i11.p1 TRINITY_DN10130_c0_g1~~TRINITY_DN10130_c0_g1_i11.p1  ORF type:complete len:224 (-),score=7.86 TRINITY_DN10130_c0_g1_i11:45-716(-)